MRIAPAFALALGLSVAPIAAMADAIFPTVTADDLNGDSKTLPADLPGDVTIMFIAYKQNQQEDVNTWVYGLGLDPYRGPEFVEVPVVGKAARMMRGFVDNGMRSGITDTAMRARTITLYENPALVNDPLGFSGRNDIRVLLVRKSGEVLWSTSGPATAQGLDELRTAYGSAM